jgi:hypothetical protein
LYFSDLSLLLADLVGTGAKALGVGQFVDVGAFTSVECAERFQFPTFAGQPSDASALNVGQVGDAQLPARWRDDRAADAIAGQAHHVVVTQVCDPSLQRGDADGLRFGVEPVRASR